MSVIDGLNFLRLAIRQASQSNDFGRLAELLDQAEPAGAVDPPTRYDAAMVLWHAFDLEGAIRAFDRLVDEGVLDDQRLMQIARRYHSAGRFAPAAGVMERVCRRRPDDPDVLAMLAGCYERGNQLEAALSVIERALKLDSGHVRSIRLMAHLERRNGQFESARRRLEDQLARSGTRDDWRLSCELAAVLDRLGAYDEAMEALKRAKRQLQVQTVPHLERSMATGERQWEVLQRMTPKDLQRWRERAGALGDAPRVVLMAGFPRSGTTLLEQMLAAHPQCLSTDETGILRSQFIDSIVYAAPSAEAALDELRGFDAEQIRAGREVYLRCTEQFIGERIGQRMLIEKDPLLTIDLPLPLALFPEAHVLMPLRDPRDVVISYFFTMVPLNWPSAPATSIEETARFYADCMRHWLLWRDELELPGLQTRYEDLVSQPQAELRRVLQHMGLPWDERVLDVSERSASKAIRTPTYDDVARPLYTRAMNRWRNYEKHLEPVLPILGPFMQAFGYA